MSKTGIIEGFYGRPWSFDKREDTIEWMASKGMDFYIYCPKADLKLRRNWQDSWSEDEFLNLKSLAQKCKAFNVSFGIGLSPFELYKDWNQKSKTALKRKIEEINKLEIDMLSILFDDMEGDRESMAEIQVKIVEVAIAFSNANSFQVCPTWYTFDPEIKALFGEMPRHYLTELGEKLPTNVDVYWTGPKVCSQEYTEEHLMEIIELLKRKPLIWDNNPVNDGVRMAPFLHLNKVNRLKNINLLTSGIGFNPMVEPLLSRIPILRDVQELNQNSVESDKIEEQIYIGELGKELGKALFEDAVVFYERGVGSVGVLGGGDFCLERSRRIFSSKGWDLLNDSEKKSVEDWQSDFEKKFRNALTRNEIQSFIKKYSEFEHPVADELVAWLEGKFAFDLNCLT